MSGAFLLHYGRINSLYILENLQYAVYVNQIFIKYLWVPVYNLQKLSVEKDFNLYLQIAESLIDARFFVVKFSQFHIMRQILLRLIFY